MFLGTGTLEDHSQLPKKLTIAAFRWIIIQAFCMYGGKGTVCPCPYYNVWPEAVHCCFTRTAMFTELFTCYLSLEM